MPLDITIPADNFEAHLLSEHFGKDPQYKWITSKDVQEAEAKAPSGYAFAWLSTHKLTSLLERSSKGFPVSQGI
jgi:hypothetical protein